MVRKEVKKCTDIMEAITDMAGVPAGAGAVAEDAEAAGAADSAEDLDTAQPWDTARGPGCREDGDGRHHTEPTDTETILIARILWHQITDHTMEIMVHNHTHRNQYRRRSTRSMPSTTRKQRWKTRRNTWNSG